MTPSPSPQIFDLLAALAHGPQHGYALMLRISQIHQGRYKPSPGVVYSNLERLVDWGWAFEVAAPTYGEDTRRKHYQISADGLAAARSHLAQEKAHLDIVSQALGRAVA